MLTAADLPALVRSCPAPVVGSGWRPDARGAWRARIPAPVAYRRRPAGPVSGVLRSRSGREADMSWALVVGARREGAACRVGLQLPQRPNGRVGWVDAALVRLVHTPWRIEVDRTSRQARLLRDGRVVRAFPVVVGKASTPTPRGLFAVLAVNPSDPGSFDGAWVVTLTAESDVLRSFGGGPGRVGLHGRGGASLLDPLGTARSHGCVRFDNASIRWIVARVGAPNLPGVPVHIG
jgi:hypothetical protein